MTDVGWERKASVQHDTAFLETEKQSSKTWDWVDLRTNWRAIQFFFFFFNESIEPKSLVIQLNWNVGGVVRVVWICD